MVDGGHGESGANHEPAASAAAAEPTPAAATPEAARAPEATTETKADRTRQLNRLMRELGLPSGANLPSELAVLREAMVAEVTKALSEPDSPETKRRIILQAAVKAQRALTEHKGRLKHGEGLWGAAKKALATPFVKILAGSAAIGAGLVIPLSVAAPAAYTGGARLVVEGLRQLTSGEGKLRRELDDAHSGFERRIEVALSQRVITRDRSPESIARFIHDFVDGVYLRELQALFSLENGFEDAVQARSTWQKSATGKIGFAALAGAMPMDIDGIPTALGAMKAGGLNQHFVAGLNNFHAGSGHWGTVGLLKGNVALNLGMLAANFASAGIGFGAAGKLIAATDGNAGRLETDMSGVRREHLASELPSHLPSEGMRTSAPSFHTTASVPNRTLTAPWLTSPAPTGPVTININAGGGGPLPIPAATAQLTSPLNPPPTETREQRALRNDPELWREILLQYKQQATTDPAGLAALIQSLPADRWSADVPSFADGPDEAKRWFELFEARAAKLAGRAEYYRRQIAELQAGKTLTQPNGQPLDLRAKLAALQNEDEPAILAFADVLDKNKTGGMDMPGHFADYAFDLLGEYQAALEAAVPAENTETVWEQLVTDLDDELTRAAALAPANVETDGRTKERIPYTSAAHTQWRELTKVQLLALGRIEKHVAEAVIDQQTNPLSIDAIPTERQAIDAAESALTAAIDEQLSSNPNVAAVAPLRVWATQHAKPLIDYRTALDARVAEWAAAPAEWTRIVGAVDAAADTNWSAEDGRLNTLPAIVVADLDPKVKLGPWQSALEKSAGKALVWRTYLSKSQPSEAVLKNKATHRPAAEDITTWDGWVTSAKAALQTYTHVREKNDVFKGVTEAIAVETKTETAITTFDTELTRLKALDEQPPAGTLTSEQLVTVEEAVRAGPMLDPDEAIGAAATAADASFADTDPQPFVNATLELLTAAGRFANFIAHQRVNPVEKDAIASEQGRITHAKNALVIALDHVMDQNPACKSAVGPQKAALIAAVDAYETKLAARAAESAESAPAAEVEAEAEAETVEEERVSDDGATDEPMLTTNPDETEATSEDPGDDEELTGEGEAQPAGTEQSARAGKSLIEQVPEWIEEDRAVESVKDESPATRFTRVQVILDHLPEDPSQQLRQVPVRGVLTAVELVKLALDDRLATNESKSTIGYEEADVEQLSLASATLERLTDLIDRLPYLAKAEAASKLKGDLGGRIQEFRTVLDAANSSVSSTVFDPNDLKTVRGLDETNAQQDPGRNLEHIEFNRSSENRLKARDFLSDLPITLAIIGETQASDQSALVASLLRRADRHFQALSGRERREFLTGLIHAFSTARQAWQFLIIEGTEPDGPPSLELIRIGSPNLAEPIKPGTVRQRAALRAALKEQGWQYQDTNKRGELAQMQQFVTERRDSTPSENQSTFETLQQLLDTYRAAFQEEKQQYSNQLRAQTKSLTTNKVSVWQPLYTILKPRNKQREFRLLRRTSTESLPNTTP